MEKLKTNRNMGLYIGLSIFMKFFPFIVLIYIIKKFFSGFNSLAVGIFMGNSGKSLQNMIGSMLLISFLTLAISIAYLVYVIVLFWGVCKDMNTICEKYNIAGNSPVYILVALLSGVTLNIYGVFWSHQQGKRLFEASGIYQRTTKSSGFHLAFAILGSVPTWLDAILWILIRTKPSFITSHLFLVFVGAIVGFILGFMQIFNMAFFIRDVNTLAEAYNGMQNIAPDYSGQAFGSGQQFVPQPENTPQTNEDAYTIPVNEWKPQNEINQQPGGSYYRMGHVVCIRGIYEGAEFQVPDELIIGRDETRANIVIQSPEISRKHCSIRCNRENGGYIVTDYSKNGVYDKNGQEFPKNTPVACGAGTILVIAQSGNEFLLE